MDQVNYLPQGRADNLLDILLGADNLPDIIIESR
jgi:hypothetical protein